MQIAVGKADSKGFSILGLIARKLGLHALLLDFNEGKPDRSQQSFEVIS